MNRLKNIVSGFVKSSISLPFLATAAVADVLPRDLDQDPSTVEAYYDTEFDITAIAHPNLPLSERFGIPRTVDTTCTNGIFCNETQPGIDRFGFMEWPTADEYIASMNNENYMGRSDWRLPRTGFVPNNLYGWLGDSHELDEILGQRYSMYLPIYEVFNYRFVTESYHPEGGRAYVRWGTARALGTNLSDGLTRFTVWPVLDGDVGTPVNANAQQVCSDFDGDGYGWNGTSTCVVENHSSYVEVIRPMEPRDLDGDLTTAEAYYHPQLEMTWLADSKTALSAPLGLTDGINPDGSFDQRSFARDWIGRINQAEYLGHNQWRLPKAIDTNETTFSSRKYDSELEVLSAHYVRLTSEIGNRFELTDGDYFVESNSLILGAQSRTYNSNRSTYVTDVDWRKSYFAWPVHDGDIGIPIGLNPVCIDTDGDGWGWTGSASCRL